MAAEVKYTRVSFWQRLKLQVGKLYANHTKLKLLATALVILLVVGLIASAVYSNYKSRSKTTVVKPVTTADVISNLKKSSNVPTIQERYDAQKDSLPDGGTYTQKDLGNLIDMALAAKALGKKEEAKTYAQAALPLINKNAEFQKQYPEVVTSIKLIANN